jgi:DNA-binding response OmpR family regulator
LAKTTLLASVLLIEGNRRTGESVAQILTQHGFEVTRVSTGKEALARVKSLRQGVVVFDSASWRGNSARLCGDLCAAHLPILVLLNERHDQPHELPEGAMILYRPFTARKLTRCVQQLTPAADGDTLEIGTVHFNVPQRHVRKGRLTFHLTPKQAQLLEVFMRHPGETLSRRYLIKRVWNWNTDDVNDTRTPDVHVRWLREMVEEDASAPVLLAVHF